MRGAHKTQDGRPVSPGSTPFDRLRDLPVPKFVEPVETNPDVTSTFAPHLWLFDKEGVEMGEGSSRLSFPKETTRAAAPVTIHDFRADDGTGPFADVISENGNGGLTDDGARHVFHVYPSVPPPG